MIAAENIQSLLCVGRFDDLMAVEPKKLGEEFSAGTIIVDEQNHMSLQDKQKIFVGQYGTMKKFLCRLRCPN